MSADKPYSYLKTVLITFVAWVITIFVSVKHVFEKYKTNISIFFRVALSVVMEMEHRGLMVQQGGAKVMRVYQ